MALANENESVIDAWLKDALREWNIEFLTDIQTRALAAGTTSGTSMIVSAPTSSGKTLVAEAAVMSVLRDNKKTIYLVSHKALADQKYLDFQRKFGEEAKETIASVGLNTGDRAEGDVDAQLIVATYEKALGLVLTDQIDSKNSLIIADELQIIADPNRGPEIETLCTIFRQRGFGQFLALTATVDNADDLAGWMNCALVESNHRDIPLYQEIWHDNTIYRVTFGHEDGNEIDLGIYPANNVTNVVNQLLELGRGPILVFTESRRQASEGARMFSKRRPRVGDGIALAEQLDLFSEPTESSEQLQENAEKRVIFHTADLSPQERQVVEGGFAESKFEVCFATSTLAAGVNYPFRTVVFPKLTYQYGNRAEKLISRSEYRNMSGRAGRLSLHPDGYTVLLPSNRREVSHANSLVLPENDRIASQFINASLRKSILTLVASRVAADLGEIMEFFGHTMYWYQLLERNSAKIDALKTRSISAIDWLVENELLEEEDDTLIVTPLGQGAALSGLLPATAVQLARVLNRLKTELNESFEEWIPAVVHAVCCSDEFRGERPTRFFPFVRPAHDSMVYWGNEKLACALDRADSQLAQSAHALMLYIGGVVERKIAYLTGVGSGMIHRLASEVAWVLDGVHKIACTPEVGCSQSVGNNVSLLARRVRWGAPAKALDIIRIAERNGVPGFGRQRAMALVARGMQSVHDILAMDREVLLRTLGNVRRMDELLAAVSSAAGLGSNRLEAAHRRIGGELGIGKLVDACYEQLGTDYEDAICKLLEVEKAWTVITLDKRKRQNVPDLHIMLGAREMVLECKTCTKSPPLIKKEEAWSVLQKAADFEAKIRRVTLGKPVFDEVSKGKVAAASDITLVEHAAFVEGLLRVHSGWLRPEEFMQWVTSPGLADIERLEGRPTYSVST